MRLRRRFLPQVLWALALASAVLRADTGDVESSHDYPGFPRVSGFVISDYDEDNPAEFDFPVARPLPDDAGHVETVHVRGHRYIIQYELGSTGHIPTLYQTQQYYEKLASENGFTIEKSGAVGNVTETFRKVTDDHQIWVYLEPAVTSNVLTVMESIEGKPAPPPKIVTQPPAPATNPAPVVVAVPPPPVEVMKPAPPPAEQPAPAPVTNQAPVPIPTGTPAPISTPAPAVTVTAPQPPPKPPAPPIDSNDDSLYQSLSTEGRVVVPFAFRPGRDELDASSQPLVDRVVAMMKRHPDLFLRIEGHTDNTGDPDVSLRLSAQRALAVQDALVDARIDQKRLDAVGVGGLQPLADNNTAQGREKNRRIELVMWKKYPALHQNAAKADN